MFKIKLFLIRAAFVNDEFILSFSGSTWDVWPNFNVWPLNNPGILSFQTVSNPTVALLVT